MNKYMKHWYVILKNDPMVLLMLVLTAILGPIVKIIVPLLVEIMPSQIQNSIIGNYYIFDVLLAAIIPFMIGFAFSLVILEELDDKVAVYLTITPLRNKGYLLSRLIYPLFAGGIFTTVILGVSSLSNLSYIEISLLTVASVSQGLIIPLLIVSFSTNKLEGIVVGKLSSLVMIGLFIPGFIPKNMEYLGFFLPSYWSTLSLMENHFYYLLISIIWILLLGRLFYRRISL